METFDCCFKLNPIDLFVGFKYLQLRFHVSGEVNLKSKFFCVVSLSKVWLFIRLGWRVSHESATSQQRGEERVSRSEWSMRPTIKRLSHRIQMRFVKLFMRHQSSIRVLVLHLFARE